MPFLKTWISFLMTFPLGHHSLLCKNESFILTIKYLLDTNICIYLMDNVYPNLRRAVYRFPAEEFALSSVVVYELFYGVEKSQYQERNRLKIERFLEQFRVECFDLQASKVAAILAVELESKGMPIGAYDVFIGAHALSLGATLVTHNTKEFLRIPALKIEDWVNYAS